MAATLALEKLFDDVVAQFAADSTEVPNIFGWRSPSKRAGQQNRICWVPGDPAGAAGALMGARQPGRNPRPLDTLLELFTVYIEGRDATSLENELLQYKAARLIFDAWYRAVYLSARTLVAVKSATWMVDRKARRHGATIRVVCTVQAMIPDEAYTDAAEDDDLTAVVDMELDSDDDEDTPNTSEDMDVPPLEEV